MYQHLCGRDICCKMEAQRGRETKEEETCREREGAHERTTGRQEERLDEREWNGHETRLRIAELSEGSASARADETWHTPPFIGLRWRVSLSALFWRVVLTALVRCWQFTFSPAGKEETKQQKSVFTFTAAEAETGSTSVTMTSSIFSLSPSLSLSLNTWNVSHTHIYAWKWGPRLCSAVCSSFPGERQIKINKRQQTKPGTAVHRYVKHAHKLKDKKNNKYQASSSCARLHVDIDT